MLVVPLLLIAPLQAQCWLVHGVHETDSEDVLLAQPCSCVEHSDHSHSESHSHLPSVFKAECSKDHRLALPPLRLLPNFFALTHTHHQNGSTVLSADSLFVRHLSFRAHRLSVQLLT